MTLLANLMRFFGFAQATERAGGGNSLASADQNFSPPQSADYVPLDDTTSTQVTPLNYQSQKRRFHAAGAAGALDHDNIILLGPAGRFRGSNIDKDRTVITSDDHTDATLSNPSGNEHMRIFREPNGAVGVIGQTTEDQDMPLAGRCRYSGVAELTVESGPESINLTADASVSVNWSNGGIATLTYSNFSVISGPKTGKIEGQISVTGMNIIGTNDSIAGCRCEYADGTLSTDISFFGALISPETDGGGRFFGPRASEAGGVIVVDDTKFGNVFITGVHAVKKDQSHDEVFLPHAAKGPKTSEPVKDFEYIPTKGKGKGRWCAGVSRESGKLVYFFPVASGHADYSFEYEIFDEHLRVLQTDEERFYLLFGVMHDAHQLKPHPTPSMRKEIFDTILFAEHDAVVEFMRDTDGRLKRLGVRGSIHDFVSRFMAE